MNKKVFIIKGSPRAEGNTATMADIFAKGAIENHNTVTEIVAVLPSALGLPLIIKTFLFIQIMSPSISFI